MSSKDQDEVMTSRGNCYYSCIQENLPEITIHSIMGLGSKHVEKMKIERTTGFETAKHNVGFTRDYNTLDHTRNLFKWNSSMTSRHGLELQYTYFSILCSVMIGIT